MKIITSLLLLTFLGINTVLFAQECGTPSDTQNQDFSDFKRKGTIGNAIFTINVYFHIVRNSSGTGGFNPSNIDLIVNNLNSVYNPYNIFINKIGVDFINNSTYYNLSGKLEFNGLIRLNNVSNAINFYLVNNYGSYAGEAEDILSKNLVVVNDYALTPTSEHEIGHCLNLYHTHHGLGCNDTGGCRESIVSSRPNCEDCGDFVCDTPADPCVLGRVNSSCEYTGGGGYNPDPTNIMSYGSSCRTNFTQGQADRMRRALASSSLLQGVVSIPKLSSTDNLCFSNSKTLTINNINNNTTTWQVSNNVSILSKNNKSITVRASYSSSTGNGWVKATLSNGIVLKEEFEVGTPPNNNLVIRSLGGFNIYSQRWTKLDVHYTNLSNFGWGTFTFEWIIPNSMTRISPEEFIVSVYPLISRGAIYIRARAKNECGCSNWVGQLFNVIPYDGSRYLIPQY